MERTLSPLSGERVRFRDDTWELTGSVDIRRNGELIEAKATTPERVRGRTARLRFELENKPRSVNPGNTGNLEVDLNHDGERPLLLLHRANGTDRYRLDSMAYD